MSHSNSNPSADSDSTPSSGFSAQSQMGLAEVLQMCCLSRRSGQITFRSGESYGYVYIQHGRVLHALCGVIEGEEAVYRMLTWPGGGFSLDEDILPHKKTVNFTWEQLLFEGARRADQGTGGLNVMPSTPVTTSEPATNRSQESQPKLTVTRPDQPPMVFDLEDEYTHVGRTPGNELPLPYPSISSRHCIFILSGPDIVLRDLNSSNGTLVNGEPITEVVLRPGDLIQIGVVEMKFEPGIKRPKLNSHVPAHRSGNSNLVEVENKQRGLSHGTVKLPLAAGHHSPATPVPDDNAYMKGVSAISYDALAKPEPVKKSFPWGSLIAVFVFILMAMAAYYHYAMAPASH